MAATTHDILKTVQSDLPEIGGEPSWLKDYRKHALLAFQSSKVEPNPLYTKYETLTRFDTSDLKVLEPPERGGSLPERFAELVSSNTFMLQEDGTFYVSG